MDFVEKRIWSKSRPPGKAPSGHSNEMALLFISKLNNCKSDTLSSPGNHHDARGVWKVVELEVENLDSFFREAKL